MGTAPTVGSSPDRGGHDGLARPRRLRPDGLEHRPRRRARRIGPHDQGGIGPVTQRPADGLGPRLGRRRHGRGTPCPPRPARHRHRHRRPRTAGPRRSATTATRPTGRHRLGGQDPGHVEQLLGGVDPDDAGLAHQGVEHVVRPLLAAEVDRGPAALHRHDRLGPRHPAGDAAELPRVAEGLQVERDDPGRLVVLPVLQEVVGRQVGLVAHRDHAREAEAEDGGPTQQGRGQRARLAEEPDRPRRDGPRQRRRRAGGHRERC